MRKALLVGTLAATLVAATAASVRADTPAATSTLTVTPRAATAAVPSSSVNARFAALAATLPVCGADDVTNCRYGTAATHVEASVQSPTATIYFEMRRGVLTVLQVYPIAR